MCKDIYARKMNNPKLRVERWVGMREDIIQFIRQCPCCQLMSQVKPLIHLQKFTLASMYPMEKVSVDSIGPLPPTPDGFQYILVVIDNFTRFVELYALRSVSAEEAAQCFLDYFGRYGAPHYIHSDRGSQFVNALIREFF